MLCWPFARYIVTVRVDCGLMVNFRGSDTTRAPFGTIKPGFPSKVSVCKVAVLIAGSPDDPFDGRAIVAAVIGRLTLLKAFEKRTRIVSPPIDICNVIRMVESLKVSPD